MSSKTNGGGAGQKISVLMYHSISFGPGPTNIPLETFKGQISAIADCGYNVISMAAFKSWHGGDSELNPRSIVITFDDGFASFADAAVPVLRNFRYKATVFLPSGKLGGTEDWGDPTRKLMDWSQIRDLEREGMEFGGHSVNHSDLTKLSDGELEREIRECRDSIGQAVGQTPTTFAPPYGRCGPRESEVIKKWFAMSFGTRFARASRDCDLYDVPRIEMHYFRDLKRWRNFLEGRGEFYYAARRALRGLRTLGKGV